MIQYSKSKLVNPLVWIVKARVNLLWVKDAVQRTVNPDMIRKMTNDHCVAPFCS